MKKIAAGNIGWYYMLDALRLKENGKRVICDPRYLWCIAPVSTLKIELGAAL